MKLTNDQTTGAEEQNRTADTAVFSRVLYQLSYLGIEVSLFYAFRYFCQMRWTRRTQGRDYYDTVDCQLRCDEVQGILTCFTKLRTVTRIRRFALIAHLCYNFAARKIATTGRE